MPKSQKNSSEERSRLDAHFSVTGQKDSPRLAYCLILKTISREDRTRLNSDSSRLLRYKALKAVIISIHFSIYPFPSGILLVSFIRSLIWSSQDIPKCHGFPGDFLYPRSSLKDGTPLEKRSSQRSSSPRSGCITAKEEVTIFSHDMSGHNPCFFFVFKVILTYTYTWLESKSSVIRIKSLDPGAVNQWTRRRGSLNSPRPRTGNFQCD